MARSSLHNLVILLAGIGICIISFFLGKCSAHHCQEEREDYIVIDSVETVDIVPDIAPTPKDSIIVRYKYVEVPIPSTDTDSINLLPSKETEDVTVTISGDTARVEIPISQNVYETEDYRAYISGYNAKIDSIFINRVHTSIMARAPTKKKRFSFGLQAGYGMTPKGLQPYLGVGVTVNLYNF